MRMKIYKLIVACCITLLLFTSASGKVLYYHTDNFGTPMAMTNQAGEVVWQADELPFGEEYETEETPNKNNHRFLGKELDDETGLVYMGARYLDPKTGRFTQPDPVGLVDPASGKVVQEILLNPQRLNRYVYGLNNPYKYIDPDGKFALVASYGGYLVASALAAGILYYGAPIAADIGKRLGNVLWNENTGENNVLPNQGEADGGVEGAPPVDAGKQGKHVPGHNNEVEGKSKWNVGETGVKETQEAWVNGRATGKKDGSVRVGQSSGGRNIKVHQDKKGKIHGYPVD